MWWHYLVDNIILWICALMHFTMFFARYICKLYLHGSFKQKFLQVPMSVSSIRYRLPVFYSFGSVALFAVLMSVPFLAAFSTYFIANVCKTERTTSTYLHLYINYRNCHLFKPFMHFPNNHFDIGLSS